MKTSIITLLILILCVNFGLAQVKIGENPDNIDPASLVELESSDKAFVLTRVNDAQMSAMSPLNGALVYNTNSLCVFYFDGTQWINLCDGANSGFTFSNNGDGTFTLDDGEGNSITWNGAPETVTTLVDNMDGTFSYTNEAGSVVTIAATDSDDQNLSGSFNLTTNEVTINIEDGANAVVDLSALEESSDIAVNTADITTNTTDIATNATDIATNATDIATNATDIAAHVAVDGDLDSANELNSAGD
ncbi:MAG: hypothetical protein OER83_04490, partial [Flavobacteriaceae bacterium]|nr:hypothetical protein [Flavobacteriaceae bacterium]